MTVRAHVKSVMCGLYNVKDIGVNMNNMYKLLCINYNDHHEKCIPLCQLSFASLYTRLCLSTAATLRKSGDKMTSFDLVFFFLLHKWVFHVSHLSKVSPR